MELKKTFIPIEKDGLKRQNLKQINLFLLLLSQFLEKKNKKGLKANLGVNFRNLPAITTSYLGGGISVSWSSIINFGYSEYQDAYVKDYRGLTLQTYDEYGNPFNIYFDETKTSFYEWHYQVKNYVVGLNLNNWAIDYSWITTTNRENNEKYYIKILNTSLFYKKWMFSLGFRHEESPREKFDYKLKKMIQEKHKYDSFLGAQYAVGKHFIIGLFNNYYLLEETSLGLTYFF